jgi:sensor c-di-GMP phosphodiesterase-like protein
MTSRRDRVLLGLSLAALAGTLLLFAGVTWYVWGKSVANEERQLGQLAQQLGEHAEHTIVDARNMLDEFNRLEVPRCSDDHLTLLQQEAISRPHVRAIGYWQATDRLCGTGFVRGTELTPARADRIYESGVIAWWPGEQTEIGGVQLFLMRYGAHDVVIDPRLLLDTANIDDRMAGLWVEGLRMAAHPWDADLPEPEAVDAGVTVDRSGNRVISRFSLGTIFPIDIVAIEPTSTFWDRHLPTLTIATLFGAVLMVAWLYVLYRYSRRQLSLGVQLREAIIDNRLLVYYQPIIELESGRCIGAEALVRWPRDGDMISPDIFIPVAEEAGLVSDITRLVLRAIVNDLGDFLREHPGIHINLNLARDDLESDNFVATLANELVTANIPAVSLKLEITERALINSDTARQLIRNLRQNGHQVAIDDFGTGYSSLSYLESFEIDTLKIDKSFVDAIETDAVTSNVITHVIDMAHSLELDTVAEGIEHEHQVEWLREHGVTHGQGYYYSKPVTARRFMRYFRRTTRQGLKKCTVFPPRAV